MDKIMCLKLSSGEEVIGKLSYEGTAQTVVKDVASVIMMPGQAQGQYSLGLMPFLPYANGKTFAFNSQHVVVQFEPSLDMLNNYNRMFGSGIQIATSI